MTFKYNYQIQKGKMRGAVMDFFKQASPLSRKKRKTSHIFMLKVYLICLLFQTKSQQFLQSNLVKVVPV